MLRINEIARSVIIMKHFSLTTVIFLSLLEYIPHTFVEQVWRKMFWTLLGDTVAKVCASHRNLTWFTVSPCERVGSGDETMSIRP